MRAPAPLLALALLGVGAAPLTAQVAPTGRPVRLEATGPALRLVEPGTSVTVAFRAANDGPVALALRGVVEPPRGWAGVVLDTGAVSLGPRSEEVVLLVFSVPPDARAGVQAVRYALQVGGQVAALDSALVEVAAVRRLSLAVLEAPPTAVAGAPLVFRFLASNGGNAPLPVRWAGSADPFPVEVRDLAEPLLPGEARVVELEVKLPREASRASRHTVRLSGEGAGAEPASASSVLDVIPNRTAGASSALRFPARLALRASDVAGAVIPLQVGGDGPISSDGLTRLSFLLRGPRVSSPVPGEQEEYRLALERPGASARLGHHVFALSPLTEVGSYGLGGELGLSLGAFDALGFGSRGPRWGDRETRAGGRIGVGSGWGRLSAQYLLREDAQVRSVRGTLSPSPLLQLSAELGDSDGAGRVRARAFALQATGSHPRLRYDALHIAGGDGYAGSFGGATQSHASAQAAPWRALHLGASYNAQEWRFSGRDQRPRATAHGTLRASVGYGGTLALEAERGDYERREPERPVSRRHETAGVRASARLSVLTLSARAQQGTVEDLLTGGRGPARVVSASAGVHGRRGAGLSLSAERWTGPSLYAWEQPERLSGWLSAALPLGGATRVQLHAQAEVHGRAWQEAFASFDANLQHRLPFGHELTLRARGWGRIENRLPATTLLVLEYAVPISFRYGQVPGTGEVRGRILDAETGLPVAGALLRLGELRVASDGAGVFVFRGVAAGAHYLDVDRGSLGPGRIVLQPLPLLVEVGEGGVTALELGVVRAAGLSGTLEIETGEGVFLAGPDVPGARVLLALSNGEWSLRRLVRAGDRFDFTHLPPGRWTLEVLSAELPPNHELRPGAASIELAPAGEETIELRVTPVSRPIRMQPLDAGPEILPPLPSRRP